MSDCRVNKKSYKLWITSLWWPRSRRGHPEMFCTEYKIACPVWVLGLQSDNKMTYANSASREHAKIAFIGMNRPGLCSHTNTCCLKWVHSLSCWSQVDWAEWRSSIGNWIQTDVTFLKEKSLCLGSCILKIQIRIIYVSKQKRDSRYLKQTVWDNLC